MALRVNQLRPCSVSMASMSSERDLFWWMVQDISLHLCPSSVESLTMMNLPERLVQVISGGAAMVTVWLCFSSEVEQVG